MTAARWGALAAALALARGAAGQGSVDADFTGVPTSGCAPLVVRFTDQSAGDGLVLWVWDFGDGETVVDPSPTHTYGAPGNYTVSLTVSNGFEFNTETKTGYIQVLEEPVADFALAPSTGCAPLEVRFTDLSRGGGLASWSWSFGDGATSSERSPAHAYASAGDFTVTLTVRGACGQDSKQAQVRVLAPSQAAFQAGPTSGCAPLAVQFTDRSTGEGLSGWGWDFGDGGTSSERSPSHTYPSPGTYTVKLTVRGSCGEDSEVKESLVRASGPPAADFGADRVAGCAPLRVAFSDRSAGDGISAWSWDFGDGGSSSERNPVHTYGSPGTYTVSLRVSSSCGEDTEVKVDFIAAALPVDAAFSAEPTAGCPPLEVAFTDQSLGTNVNSWSWDFGDGSRSFLRSPVHTYAAPGTYTVTLRARGDCGEDTEVRAGLIAVAAPVAADFSASVTRGCAPDFQVVFTDLSRGDGLSAWSWDFGDGETSAERSPAHVYREPGVYTVTLAARGVCGEDVESKAGLILVDGPPAAPEEVRYPAAGFAGDTVTVRWPESARAARYLVEAAVAGERDWFEACQVEDDPALRELSCSVALDETGSWRFRVRALNDCGESVPLEGPPLEVAPPAVFASWPLDACVALDVEKGNDGRLSGTVTCGTDRFGDARTALRFRGDGLVQGSSLPPWDGDFSASLWFLPREAAGSSAAGARMLELHRDDGRAAAPPLRLSWIDRELAVTVAHGDGGGIRFDGVGRAWHHLAVTRARGTLTAFLDGVAGAPMADSGGLGDGFAMGGAPGGTALFVGNLDEVLYESRARSPDDVASLILGRPGTVLLRGQTLPAVSLSPGGRAEVLRLPLRTGSPRGPQGFALKVLRLTLRDLASEPGGGFDFVARAALLERSRCDGAAPATEEVGVFRVVPVSQAAASLELALSPGRPLPAPGDACFSVEIEVGPHALARDRVVQLVLETPDELSVSDGALAAFVAGPRRAGAPSLEGARVHVLNQPPELRFSLEALPETVEARSPVEDAELHEVLLAAGSTEGVVIERLVYHALEDARVDAIRSAALVLEEPAGDRKVADGLVDLAAQEVRFEGLALEVPAAGAARLSLRGDLEVARKKPGAALGAVVPTPAAPGAAGGALRGALAGSAALCALAGLAVALARARPARPRLAFRLAGALCLWAFAGLGLAASGCGPAIIGAGVAVGVIASSDSGGGHGGGPAFTARIQLGIVGPEDLSAKGATSGAPAVLDLGEGGIAGPLYEVKGR